MDNPHKPMLMRNRKKGFLATWCLPLTISKTSKATQNTTSVRGISMYSIKAGDSLMSF